MFWTTGRKTGQAGWLARIGGDRRGVSAVEFSLILPVLVLMFGAAVELSGAITAGNRATNVAKTIGLVVAQAKGPIAASDMAGFIKLAAIIDPDIVRYASATGKSLETAADVAVSSVVFTPQVPNCVANCVYKANVVFSEALSGAKRACGTLTSGGSGKASLPASVFSPSSLVVVDVNVYYRPLMTKILGEQIVFQRSSYFPPRYIDHVNYEKNCSGYPVS